jgi:hypothetical protein
MIKRAWRRSTARTAYAELRGPSCGGWSSRKPGDNRRTGFSSPTFIPKKIRAGRYGVRTWRPTSPVTSVNADCRRRTSWVLLRGAANVFTPKSVPFFEGASLRAALSQQDLSFLQDVGHVVEIANEANLAVPHAQVDEVTRPHLARCAEHGDHLAPLQPRWGE